MTTGKTSVGQAADTALNVGFDTSGAPLGGGGQPPSRVLAPFQQGKSAARTWLNILSALLIGIAVVLIVLAIIFIENPAAVTALSGALGIDVLAAINLVRKNAKDLYRFEMLEELLPKLPPEHQRELLLQLSKDTA